MSEKKQNLKLKTDKNLSISQKNNVKKCNCSQKCWLLFINITFLLIESDNRNCHE